MTNSAIALYNATPQEELGGESPNDVVYGVPRESRPASSSAVLGGKGGGRLPTSTGEVLRDINERIERLPARIVSKRGPLGPGIPEQGSSCVVTREENKWLSAETDPSVTHPKGREVESCLGNLFLDGHGQAGVWHQTPKIRCHVSYWLDSF